MAEIIHCSQCRRELQIPEEFIGRPVKCPSCGLNFITTRSAPRPPAAPDSIPEVTPAPPPPPAYSAPYGMVVPPTVHPHPPVSNADRARRAVIAPAVIMLILAPIWMLCDVFQIFRISTMKFEEEVEKMQVLPPGSVRDLMEESLRMQTDPAFVRGFVIFQGVMIFTSLIVFSGALQMYRMRMWGFALVAAILTLLHFDNACCGVINFAAGIYAIIVLFLPWVRSAFQ